MEHTALSAYAAAHFLGFTPLEVSYLLTLVALARTNLAQRRQELLESLQQLRAQSQETSAHLRTPPLPQNLGDYYLDPNLQLIHMFLTVDRYRHEPEAIGEALHLSEAQVMAGIERLASLGLVSFDGGAYRVLREELHLPAKGSTYEASRTLMRVKALEQIARQSQESSYNFSVIFTADAATREAIQAKFLDFIRGVQEQVLKAKLDEVYQMNFDLFSWSTGSL